MRIGRCWSPTLTRRVTRCPASRSRCGWRPKLRWCAITRCTGISDGGVVPGPGAGPPPAGLWQHTCFEAFLAAPGVAGYYEFNFTPTLDWAAYQFTDYRDGMTPAD